jgi:NAD(P)-dependent dehydrogenase (short-subunit alcohol dehydrogenase family)
MANILLAGASGALLSELAEEALAAGNRVAVTTEPGGDEAVRPGPEDRQSPRYIAWNPRSPLSARAVVNGALNAFGLIDEALIVFSARAEKKDFHDLSFADMEKTVDESVKSFFFLVKEVFTALQRQRKGVLSFVHHDGGVEVLPPPQAAASAAFRAFASSLFAQYQNEAFGLYGYYSSSAESRDFARFLCSLAGSRTEKTSRRWIKFSGKPGFFSFAKNK